MGLLRCSRSQSHLRRQAAPLHPEKKNCHTRRWLELAYKATAAIAAVAENLGLQIWYQVIQFEQSELK